MTKCVLVNFPPSPGWTDEVWIFAEVGSQQRADRGRTDGDTNTFKEGSGAKLLSIRGGNDGARTLPEL
jgi:hypothetical protein